MALESSSEDDARRAALLETVRDLTRTDDVNRSRGALFELLFLGRIAQARPKAECYPTIDGVPHRLAILHGRRGPTYFVPIHLSEGDLEWDFLELRRRVEGGLNTRFPNRSGEVALNLSAMPLDLTTFEAKATANRVQESFNLIQQRPAPMFGHSTGDQFIWARASGSPHRLVVSPGQCLGEPYAQAARIQSLVEARLALIPAVPDPIVLGLLLGAKSFNIAALQALRNGYGTNNWTPIKATAIYDAWLGFGGVSANPRAEPPLRRLEHPALTQLLGSVGGSTRTISAPPAATRGAAVWSYEHATEVTFKSVEYFLEAYMPRTFAETSTLRRELLATLRSVLPSSVAVEGFFAILLYSLKLRIVYAAVLLYGRYLAKLKAAIAQAESELVRSRNRLNRALDDALGRDVLAVETRHDGVYFGRARRDASGASEKPRVLPQLDSYFHAHEVRDRLLKRSALTSSTDGATFVASREMRDFDIHYEFGENTAASIHKGDQAEQHSVLALVDCLLGHGVGQEAAQRIVAHADRAYFRRLVSGGRRRGQREAVAWVRALYWRRRKEIRGK